MYVVFLFVRSFWLCMEFYKTAGMYDEIKAWLDATDPGLRMICESIRFMFPSVCVAYGTQMVPSFVIKVLLFLKTSIFPKTICSSSMHIPDVLGMADFIQEKKNSTNFSTTTISPF